jgi:hypothetical protein
MPCLEIDLGLNRSAHVGRGESSVYRAAAADDARSDEMVKDETRLYTAFRRYIEAYPIYEPFARPFTSTHGRMHIFHRTPATRLAIRWLWEDLEALGFLKDTAPHDI